jgi:hypothetical protein
VLFALPVTVTDETLLFLVYVHAVHASPLRIYLVEHVSILQTFVAPSSAVHPGVNQLDTLELFEQVTEHAVFAVALYDVPVPDVVRPAGQAVQPVDADEFALYVPTGQLAHDFAPAAEYVPLPHELQVTLTDATPAVPICDVLL